MSAAPPPPKVSDAQVLGHLLSLKGGTSAQHLAYLIYQDSGQAATRRTRDALKRLVADGSVMIDQSVFYNGAKGYIATYVAACRRAAADRIAEAWQARKAATDQWLPGLSGDRKDEQFTLLWAEILDLRHQVAELQLQRLLTDLQPTEEPA